MAQKEFAHRTDWVHATRSLSLEQQRSLPGSDRLSPVRALYQDAVSAASPMLMTKCWIVIQMCEAQQGKEDCLARFRMFDKQNENTWY